MKGLFILVAFCLSINIYYAQTINTSLDSIMNASLEKRTKFIYITNGLVSVDTLRIKKVNQNKKDTSIVLTFSDKSTRSIKAFEFWGLITDFGERRRFYKGKMFPLWRMEAPYFYKITFNNNPRYYFSESLTSPIYALNKENIDKQVTDSIAKRNMNLYIKDHNIKPNNAEREVAGLFIDASYDVAEFLLTGILLRFYNEYIK